MNPLIYNSLIEIMRQEVEKDKEEANKVELFKIELDMWVEIKIGGTWVIGQIFDIDETGRIVWVETHNDTYKINRVAESRKIRQFKG